MRKETPLRAALGVIGMALLVILIIAAFGRIFGSAHAPGAGSAPTFTLEPVDTPPPGTVSTVTLTTGVLAWRSVPVPAGLPQSMNEDVFAVAPSDGNTIYVCFHHEIPRTAATPYVAQAPQLWVTHDRGLTWRLVPLQTLTQETGTCHVEVDRLDPNIALFGVDPQNMFQNPSGQPQTWFVTRDGGQTWHSLPGDAWLTGLHSRDHRTFAVRMGEAGTGYEQHVVVSQDDLATWKMIDPPSRFHVIMGLWGDPLAGALLVLLNTGDVGWELWSTHDSGAHWRQWVIPALNGWVAREATGGQPWIVCTYASDGGSNPHPVRCSDDDGSTWKRLPGIPGRATWPQMIAIAADGSLLARGTPEPIDTANHVIYRLKPGAASWELLGETPPSQYRYTPEPGAGTLWIGPGFDGIGQYRGIFYTADYPA